MSFKLSYSFEGNHRSRPEQNLSGASQKLTRERLLQKSQDERQKRQEQRMKVRSTYVLQAHIRSYLVRKGVKEVQRAYFDRNRTALPLHVLLSRLLFFYDPAVDAGRLQRLAVDMLERGEEVRRWAGGEDASAARWLLRRFLARCVEGLAHWGLRRTAMCCVESFARDQATVVYLIRRGYFDRLGGLLEEAAGEGAEGATEEDVTLVLGLIDMPFRYCSDTSVVIPAFTSSFLEAAGASATTVRRVLLPHMKARPEFPYERLLGHLNSGCHLRNTNGLLRALLVLEPDGYEPTRDAVQVFAKLTRNVHTLRHKVYLVADDSDDDDEMDVDPSDDHVTLDEILHALNRPDRVRKWLALLYSSSPSPSPTGREQLEDREDKTGAGGGGEAVFEAIVEVCHSLLLVYGDSMRKYLLLYRLGLSGRFLNDLWAHLNARGPVQARLRTPDLMHWGRTQTALSVFCDMFTFYTETLTDRENTDTRETFTRQDLFAMAQALKVLSLDLIEVAFPMCRSSSVLATPELLHLYGSCLGCLRVMYTLDVRRGFCPAGFWTARKLHVSYDLYRKNCLGKGVRPFSASTAASAFVSGASASTSSSSAAAASASPGRQTGGGGNDGGEEEVDERLPPLSTIEQRSLAVFQMLPFLIDFNTRVLLLRELCRASLGDNDYQRLQRDFLSETIVIRRTHLYEDAFEKLSALSDDDLRRRVKIQFINSAGLEEAGIDGGGVFKEFVNEALRTAFDPNRGFFLLTADNTLYPNPHVGLLVPDYADHYRLIGRLVGKAVFEHVLVDLPLAEFFLAKLLVDRTSAHYLRSLDPVLYRNLLYLRDYAGDVSELGLDFTTISNDLGEMRIVELKAGGQHIAVTNDNRLEYVQRLADLKLNGQLQRQCAAFREGLDGVVPLHWLRLFNHAELQIILSGDSQEIDLGDLRQHTVYSGEFAVDHPTVLLFWKVVGAFTDTQRRQLLKFVTSCSRPPLFGFKELNPPFCVQSSGTEDRMPTSSTCLNLLKIPIVRDETVLRQKLLAAVEQQVGFELS